MVFDVSNRLKDWNVMAGGMCLLRRLCFALLSFLVCFDGEGQVLQSELGYTWEQFVEDYLEYTAELEESGEDDVVRYDWLEDLEEIHRNPIDINRAERSELEALHFLGDAQMDSLLAHRDRYSGGLRSVGELLTVPQLGFRERAWLSLLLKFVPLTRNADGNSDAVAIPRRRPTLEGSRWRDGTHDVTATVDIPLYERAGFGDLEDKNLYAKAFTGQRLGHTLRYRYNWRHRTMYGATVQQDVGEPFACHGSLPWDYGSAYFYYKSNAVPLRQLGSRTNTKVASVNRYEMVAGDYKICLGQGIVMGNSGWNVREALMTGFSRESTRLSPHTGVDESRFLRGAAANIRLGRAGQWQLTGFASWRRLDGTLHGDTVTAWKVDGQHRTLQELDKRHVATQYVVGGRAGYRIAWLNVGVNAVWLRYDKPYCPPTRAYNKYYMRGNEATAASVDYALHSNRWSLQGEVAFDRNLACASSTTLRWRPLRAMGVVLQERSLAKDFVSPYGRTMLFNSQLQNEHGALAGIEYRGWRRVELMGYADVALHRYPVYRADTLSHRYEAMVQGVFRTRGAWTHTLRYKVRGRELNVSGYKDLRDFDGVLLSWRTTQHVRWQSTWNNQKTAVTFGTDFAHYYSQGTSYDKKTQSIEGIGSSLGALVFVRATASWRSRWRLTTMATAFRTADYDSRVYTYAPQLAGSISVPTYAGDGVAATLLVNGQLWRGLHLALRYAFVRYFDASSIGTGINLIRTPWKNDLSLQLRYRF